MLFACGCCGADAFKKALAELRSDTSDVKYIVAAHPDVNPNALDLVVSGSGDADEMLTHFDSSQVMYGMLRETEKVEISTTTKFIFIKQVSACRAVDPDFYGVYTDQKF